MTINVVDLPRFFLAAPWRRRAAADHQRSRALAGRAGLRVFGLGYPTPCLGLFPNGERCIAVARAQGVLKWPTARPAGGPRRRFSLPLPMPGRPHPVGARAGNVRSCGGCCARCGGCWRRPGRWSRSSRTGVGCRPAPTPRRSVTAAYSRSQITRLLRQTWFTPTAWGEAFLRTAGRWRRFVRSAMASERVGAALSLPFAGCHIVEATKQVYRAIPAHRERTRLISGAAAVLVPSSLQRCRSTSPGARAGIREPARSHSGATRSPD